MSVVDTIKARAKALVQKGASTEQDAVSKVFKDDPSLYKQYVAEVTPDSHVAVYPGRDANGVTKRETVAGLTIKQASERVLLDMAAEISKRGNVDMIEAIREAASTPDGRKLYEVIRDPRAAVLPMPARKVAVNKLDVLRKAERTVAAALRTGRDVGDLGEVIKGVRETAAGLPGELARRLVQECNDFLTAA